MGKKVKSARGEIIDLDLFKIKEQIASNPAPVDVKQRQDFIERRLRRRLKKKEMESASEIAVEPLLPTPDDNIQPNVEEKLEQPEEKVETNDKPAKKSRQRARPSRRKATDQE